MSVCRYPRTVCTCRPRSLGEIAAAGPHPGHAPPTFADVVAMYTRLGNPPTALLGFPAEMDEVADRAARIITRREARAMALDALERAERLRDEAVATEGKREAWLAE